jgi:RNase H-fold protein (predicted Holliday junction resolvase)
MIFKTVSDFLLHHSPLKGEILGVDVGFKKTGLAVTVGERKLILPSSMIYESLIQNLAHKIKHTMQEKDCNYAILGFPFAWEEGASAQRIMNLSKALSSIGVIVLLYDENRTSVQIKQIIFEQKGRMSKKDLQNYDSKVASLILSNAMDEINSF